MSWKYVVYPTPQSAQPLSRGAAPRRGPLGPESGVAQLVGGPLEFPKGWSRARLFPEYSDTYALQRAPTGWPFPESGAQAVVSVPMWFSGPSRGAVTVRGNRLYESGFQKAALNTSNPDCVEWCADSSARQEWGEAACQECEANWLTPPTPEADCLLDCQGATAPTTFEDWQTSGCNQCGQFPGGPEPSDVSTRQGQTSPPPPAPTPQPGSEAVGCDFCFDMWAPECDLSPCAEWLEEQAAEHSYWDQLKEEIGIDTWDDWDAWWQGSAYEPEVVSDDKAPTGSKSKRAADARKRATTLPVGQALHAVSTAPAVMRPEYVAIGVGGLAVALGAWWLWSRRG